MRAAIAFTCLAAFAPVAAAQTSFPMVTHVSPVAVQRGTTAEVTVECRTSSLAGAYKVLVEGTGVTAEVIPGKEPPKPPTRRRRSRTSLSCKLKVTVAADAPLGVREFRIASPLGISSLGQLVVVDAPVVAEKPEPSTRRRPQPVPVPSRRLRADRGSRRTSITTSSPRRPGRRSRSRCSAPAFRTRFTTCRSTPTRSSRCSTPTAANWPPSDDGFFADPVLTFTVPKDGEYRVAVRDAKYDGDPRWAYALSITDKPVRAALVPAGGEPRQDGEGVAGRAAPRTPATEWTLDRARPRPAFTPSRCS